jgi:hypothetical protein
MSALALPRGLRFPGATWPILLALLGAQFCCLDAGAAAERNTPQSPVGRFLLVASDGLYVVEENGRASWSHQPSSGASSVYDDIIYDGWPMAEGRVLYSTHRFAREIDRNGRTLWEYRAAGKGEIKSAIPLPNGNVALIESEQQAILEVDRRDGRTVRRISIPARGNEHTRYNLLRRTPAGTFLVALREEKRVVEVDARGLVLLELPCAATVAERLEDGSTLVSGHGLQRFDATGREVWSFSREDAAPSFRMLLGAGFALLPGDRILATNSDWHYRQKGENEVQLYIVSRDKKVEWTLRVRDYGDWKRGVVEPKTGLVEHRCMMVRLMP